MPTSRPNIIPYICDKIIALQPKTVLDIGVGFGKFGFLAREYTDIWSGRYNADEWQTIIHGVEIYKPYIGIIQQYIYDEIFIQDALAFAPIDIYDLILCPEVIEHLGRDGGHALLRRLKVCGRVSIVTTPIKMSRQGAVFGNPAEAHICQWERGELMKYGTVMEVRGSYVLEMLKGEE